MRRVRVEHDITNVACFAKVFDVETGDLLNGVVSLDLNLSAGEPVIKGKITSYVLNSKGSVETDWESEDQDPLTESEDVEIMSIDSFDQSKVGSD